MGSIRMILLDGLTVADLLALRQGGFFEGAEVRLAQGGADQTSAPVVIPVQEVTQPIAVPVVPDPPVTITPEQQALLDAAYAEMAEYRVKSSASVTVEAGSGSQPAIDSSPSTVAATDPAPITTAGLPSVTRLAACTKLRDVMQLLVEGGMPSSELAGYLESVKAEVPLLQRIANIPDRVARTLEVMGAGG